jgi:outer membrane immunogenic protein
MSKYPTQFALQRGLVMTRSIILGGLAISALLIALPLGAASAADMPVKAPAPPPPPAFDWNGFYVGAYAGAAWMDQATTSDPCNPAFSACVVGVNGNAGGPFATSLIYDMGPSFIGGGRIGYNWQPTPFTLLGLENDLGYLHLKGSIVMDPTAVAAGLQAETGTTKLGNWYDAFTARVGAVDGHAMFYVKGGGAVVRDTTGVTFSPGTAVLNTTTTKTLDGWVAGGGIEYGIDMHWSLRAEYLVLGVAQNVTTCGTGSTGGVVIPGSFCSVSHSPDVQTITVGLNYRFR